MVGKCLNSGQTHKRTGRGGPQLDSGARWPGSEASWGDTAEQKVNAGVSAAVQAGQQHQDREGGCWDDRKQ